MWLRRLDLALREGPASGAANALRRWDMRRVVSVRCELDDGVGAWLGEGEAAPLPGHSEETAEAALHALRAIALPLDLLEARTMDGLARVTAAVPVASARYALETACADALSRARGVPVEDFLGVQVGAPVRLAALVAGPEDAAERAAEGYASLKLKVGRDAARDAARVREVRTNVGPRVGLRLDANGAFRVDEARAFLAAVADLGVEFVEEPVPAAELAALGDLPVPIALDETLAAPNADALVESLSASGRLAALVLKPTVLGGLEPVARWARWAKAHGVSAVLSHTFGGPVELRMTLALAAAVGTPRIAHGLAPHGALGAWDPRPVRGLARGEFLASSAPGLGLPESVPPWAPGSNAGHG